MKRTAKRLSGLFIFCFLIVICHLKPENTEKKGFVVNFQKKY